MIIKLVSAFAGLDQKLVCSVPDFDLVRKSLVNIGKKLFISNMDEYKLRFADDSGDNVDYSRPAIDPTKKWNAQDVKAGTIIYVLKKEHELSEEEQEEKIAEAKKKRAEEDAKKAVEEEEKKAKEAKEEAEREAAVAAKKEAILQANKQEEETAVVNNNKPPSTPATPPRSSTPISTSAPTSGMVTTPAQSQHQVQQQQQPSTSFATTTTTCNNNSSNNINRAPHSSSTVHITTSSSALSHTPPPPPSGNITVIDSHSPASSSAGDLKTAESLIYQLREQNKTLRDQVFALETRNRELESRVVSNAYSSESSPAVIAQMQLRLRDADIEIQRLRSNEQFLREQLEEARAGRGAGGANDSTESLLKKLDPQTRAILTEDREMLASLVEKRRQNLASSLSLYQLAHDDVELSKIRIQQERERREALLTTSAYSKNYSNCNNNNNLAAPLQITSSSSVVSSSGVSNHNNATRRR